MVTFLHYLILGILQGILEWLPVSSEGQLILVSTQLLSISSDDALSIALWLHLGTSITVIVKYSDQWKNIIKINYETEKEMIDLLFYSTIGTAITGVPILLFAKSIFFDESISNILLVLIGLSLIITGLLIQYSKNNISFRELSDLSKREMFILGFAQGLSIIPGISRSGTTVSMFLFLKVDTQQAFKGSFFMAVPASLGAVFLEIMLQVSQNEDFFANISIAGIIFANLLAFIIGLLTISILIAVAKKYNFAIITIIYGLLILTFI